MKKPTGRSPPFNVGVERFLGLGYHPGLEVRPGTFKYPDIYPGCYEVTRPRRIVSKVPRWQRLQEVQEYSKRLGYRGEHILNKKQWIKTVNGPGWQDLPTSAVGKDITFAKGERFPAPNAKSFAVPGPGTYGKNHVPYSRLEEKSRSKGFSHSTLPPFERSSRAPRSLSVQRSYHLPPNLYNLRNSIDELITKRVSKRGPYDLFSCDRFPDLPPNKLSLLNYKIHPKDLKHPQNLFKGKFFRCGKDAKMTSRIVLIDLSLTYKHPSEPGPNYYDPYPAPGVTPATCGFNSSIKEARPKLECRLQPPPGRYNHEFKKRIKGDGLKSAFLSKTKRDFSLPPTNSWFE